jgi:hypothetical protein
VSLTDSEPEVLRALHDKRDGGVIDGNVATADLLRANRARDIRVVLRREGTVVSEIRSDFAGRFQTGWLTPGTYIVSVQATTSRVENRREVVVSRNSRCISLGSIGIKSLGRIRDNADRLARLTSNKPLQPPSEPMLRQHSARSRPSC